MFIPFRQHIPNALTCCNLMSGCIATGTAFYGNYQWALLMILVGALFDFVDGLSARALGVSSPIGKELDSLADVVTFGVAPSAILFYLFHEVCYPEFLTPLSRVLPYVAFLLAAFSALRLAKFNLDTRQTTQFIGLPTPANAIFWSSLVLSYHRFLVSPRFNVIFLVLLLLLFCWMLVCEVPMLALKFHNLSWRENRWRYILVIGALPMLVFGYFALIIVWYIVLSVIHDKVVGSEE